MLSVTSLYTEYAGDRGEAIHAAQDVSFDVPVERSSWVALRIYPSSHTNPIFVLVGGKPVRTSKASAEWCLKAVDQGWSQKVKKLREDDVEAAEKAYDVARAASRKILAESPDE